MTTKDTLIAGCFAIYWMWSMIDIICNLDFLSYCYYVLPCFAFAFILKTFDCEKENSRDVSVQTDCEIVELRNASSQTDDFYAGGDRPKTVVETPNDVSDGFEHFGNSYASNTNPFIEKWDSENKDKDNTSTTDGTIVFKLPALNAVPEGFTHFERHYATNTNPFIETQDFECSYQDTTSTTDDTIVFKFPVLNSQKQNNPFVEKIAIQNPPTLFPEPPDFDNSLFEVEEQELIDIFEKPCLINNPFAEAYLNNPFSDSIVFLDNPYQMLFKTERSVE